MDGLRIEALQARVSRLERECRRWRWAALGVLAVGAMVGASQVTADGIVLRTQRLVLTDREGRERGLFEISPTDGPSLAIRDKGKRTRILLRLSGSGEAGRLLFLDANGRPTGKIP